MAKNDKAVIPLGSTTSEVVAALQCRLTVDRIQRVMDRLPEDRTFEVTDLPSILGVQAGNTAAKFIRCHEPLSGYFTLEVRPLRFGNPKAVAALVAAVRSRLGAGL